MRRTIGVAVTLFALTLGGCSDLARIISNSTQPMRVSTVNPRAEPVIRYAGYRATDPVSDFADPLPRYLATTSVRQAALSLPKPVSASTLPYRVRVDPPSPGVAEPGSSTETEALPSDAVEERVKFGKQRHEEAMRAMDERIVEREREAQRTLRWICNGC